MSLTYPQILLYFFIYSFVGWMFESALCSVMERRPVNRGFLRGPICPVYGIGIVSIVVLAGPFRDMPWLVFLISLVAVTLLEYFVGWLLETLFSMRWWDYSHCKFNLKGYICLKNSLFFGVMGLVILYFLHPPIEGLVAHISASHQRVIGSSLAVVLVLDLLTTLTTLLGVRDKLCSLQFALSEMDALEKEHGWYDKKDLSASLVRLKELIVAHPDPEDEEMLAFVGKLEAAVAKTEQASAKLEQAWRGRSGRLLRAYPHLRTQGLDATVDRLREYWGAVGKRKAAQKSTSWWTRYRKVLRQSAGPYRLSWVFLIAGVLGYLLETAYCILTTGSVESRQGLLYGPFNQVYAFGAVLMILVLLPLRRKGNLWVFAGGAVLGGSFEWLCSWLQETVLGTVSWDYTDHAVSIGGRTSLLYMFFWGVLGLWLIWGVYPWLCRKIRLIPKRQGKVICAVLTVALLLNMILSAMAVDRWNQREQGVPPKGAVSSWLDRQYPDEIMEEVYPNMIHLQE